jgi:phosphatidylglycerol:prolipoprotein diacylglycerol transferase
LYPIIQLAQGLEIPSFFLVISLVLSISLFWIVSRAKAAHLPAKEILDLSMLVMAASVVGARLFHVIYENPEYYAESPLKVLFLWDGGFVYFGGAFFAAASAWIYLYMQKLPNAGNYFDAFAPVLAFAYGAGRIGCFLAGCCYGKACFVPWAVDGLHPTQLYATFWEFGVVLLLLGLEKTSPLKRPGNLFLFWVSLHSVGRILMEHFRDDFRGAQILGLSVSSAICVVLFIVSTASLLVRSRRPE